MIKQQFRNLVERCFIAILFLMSSFSIVHADDTEATIPNIESAFPSLIAEDNVKQQLEIMKLRLNNSIEEWGNGLTRDDFEWTWSGRILKQPKRIEICNIFQSLINDTYLLLRQNQTSLSDIDQKHIESRQAFIQQLGIKNNTIPTKMGFDCIIK